MAKVGTENTVEPASDKPMSRTMKLRVYPNRSQARQMGSWLYQAHRFRNEAVSFVNDRRRERCRWIHQHPALAKGWVPEELAGSEANACSKWLTARLGHAREEVRRQLGLKLPKAQLGPGVERAFAQLSRGERASLADAWLLTVPRTVLDQVIQDLGHTIAWAMSDRRKRKTGDGGQGKQVAGFPKHQKWSYPNSVRLQAQASKNQAYRDHWEAGELFVPGLGRLRFRDRSDLPATPAKLITLARNAAGHWHASFALAPGEGKAALQHQVRLGEVVPLDPETGLPACQGVDVGLGQRSTSSCGKASGKARHLRSQEKGLRKANKSAARRKRGSKRWMKAKHKQGRLHVRIANEREAAIRQEARALAKSAAIVCVEDLSLGFMLQNPRQAKSAHDSALGRLKQVLREECEKHGHLLIECGRFDASSKTCSKCLAKNNDLTIDDRTWTCSECAQTHDREHNAAVNIRWMALQKAVHQYHSAPETGVRALASHRIKPELEAFIARGGLAALLGHHRPRESQTGEACTSSSNPLGPGWNREQGVRRGV